MSDIGQNLAVRNTTFRDIQRDKNYKNSNSATGLRLPLYSTHPGIRTQGQLYFNSSTNILYVSTPTEWVPIGMLFANCICIGNIIAGNNVEVTTDINNDQYTFTISANLTGDLSDLYNSGNGQSLIVDGVGPDLVIRSISGENINVMTDSNTIIITITADDLLNTCFVTTCANVLYPNAFVLSNGLYTTVVQTSETVSINIDLSSANTTLTSSGNGESLVVNGGPQDFVIRSVSGNNLIDVTTDANTIVVSGNTNLINACFVTTCNVSSIFPNSFILSNGLNTTVNTTSTTVSIDVNVASINTTLTSSGNGESLVVDGVGPDLIVRSISGNNLINVTTDANTIVVSGNTALINACFVTTCNVSSTFPNSYVLSNGLNTTVNTTSTTVQIDVDLSSLNTILTSSGNGQSLVVDGVGPDLVVRSIAGNNLINVTTDANTIVISGNTTVFNTCFVTQCNITSLFPGSYVLSDGLNTVVTTQNSNIYVDTAPIIIINNLISNTITTDVLVANTATITNLISTNVTIENLITTDVLLLGNVSINCNTPDPSVMWIAKTDNSDDDFVGGIYAYNSTVYRSGSFLGESTTVYNSDDSPFSTVTSDAASTGAAYIISYDSGGFANWTAKIAGDFTFLEGVHADNTGVYTTGWSLKSIGFGYANIYNASGTTQVLSNVSYDINSVFVPPIVKFDLNGQVLWAAKLDNGASDLGEADLNSVGTTITSDSANIYIVGVYGNNSNVFNANMNTQTDTGLQLTTLSQLAAGAYLLKMDKNGQTSWVTKVDSTASDRGFGITIGNNNIYITGSIETAGVIATVYNANGNTYGNVPTASGIIVDADTRSAYMVKYNQEGQASWATRISGGTRSIGYSASFEDSAIYFTGRTVAVANLYNASGGTAVDANIQLPVTSAYVAKYDENGQAIWGTVIESDISVSSISTDSSGVYVVALYETSANVFNANGQTPVDTNIQVVSSAARGAFVVKYDHDGQAVWVINIDSSSSIAPGSIHVEDNNVYITGIFETAVDISLVTETTTTLLDSIATPDSIGSYTIKIAAPTVNNDSVVNICANTNIYANLTVTGQTTILLSEISFFTAEDIFITELIENGSIAAPVTFDETIMVRVNNNPNIYYLPLIDTQIPI